MTRETATVGAKDEASIVAAVMERVRPHIRALNPYVPGEQPQEGAWVKLNTNENPYPPSPKVVPAVAAEVDRLRLYPEPTSRCLREAIGNRLGHPSEGVLIGNGSDDILSMITSVFASAPGVGHTVPSYSLYPVVAGLAGASMVDIPLDASLELDAGAVANCGASVFFLTSPNAPTGVAFPLSAIRTVLESSSAPLVVDEAYVDFGGESAVSLLAEFPQLIVVRTFSKSYGLAGARVGFALGHPEVIRMLDRVRDVYNVDRLAQAAALAAFEDVEYFNRCRDAVIATRERVRGVLDGWGWFTYPSASNFLFTQPQRPGGEAGPSVAEALFQHLLKNRILVRYFSKHPLTCGFLRVSVGTDAEMDRFLEITQQWLNNV
jgi:histidinol-phosphate aminotransferase